MEAIVLITQSGDWEALYIDGKLIEEGESLGDGAFREFWLDVAHKYNVLLSDLVIRELSDRDNDNVSALGGMPLNMNDFIDGNLYS